MDKRALNATCPRFFYKLTDCIFTSIDRVFSLCRTYALVSSIGMASGISGRFNPIPWVRFSEFHESGLVLLGS